MNELALAQSWPTAKHSHLVQEFLDHSAEKLPKAIAQWADAIAFGAQVASDEYGYELCPYLVAGVMSRESGGGIFLTPKGPFGTGDNGHGRGLMQIDDRAHKAFLAELMPDGTPAWKNPHQNVAYGCHVLAFSVVHFVRKPVPLHPRLALAAGVAAYNCGISNVEKALSKMPRTLSLAERLLAVDRYTTPSEAGQPGDYSQDVLRRRDEFTLHP